MRYLLKRTLFILLCLLLVLPTSASALQPRSEIVPVNNEKYTYDMMLRDLGIFAESYPDTATLDSIGESCWGQDIPVLIVGNPKAKRSVLIQGSMHAREYMGTLLIMKQIEYILQNPGALYEDMTFAEILDGCNIWFIPMLNPDGVQLSQFGLAGIEDAAQRQELLSMNKGSTNFRGWKANGRGVDLNRNYPVDWGMSKTVKNPAPDNYPGEYAGSEPETVALVRATFKSDALITVSYHSRGSYMYWYYKQTGTRYVRDKGIASALRALTGYWFISESESASAGQGYRDWFIVATHRPGFTLEIGSSNYPSPQPISEFADIWKRNRNVAIYTAWKGATAQDIR